MRVRNFNWAIRAGSYWTVR